MSASMIDAPSGDIEAVTLDTDLKFPTKALWIGAAGNVSVVTRAGQTVVIPGVPAGFILPVRVTRVTSSNTSVASPSTNILALF